MRNKLTVTAIKSLPAGKHHDGGGLILVRDANGSRWVLRYTAHGKRREMGLGALYTVTLAAARQARDHAAAIIQSGLDPIRERDLAIALARTESQRIHPTITQLVQLAFDARKATLRGDGTAGRWLSPLTNHVLPAIGHIAADDLTASDIRRALQPIWHSAQPTAVKAITRLHIALTHGKMTGAGSDPAIVTQARHMLGAVRHTVTNICATPWQDIPAFYARLHHGTAAHDCLRLIIITATRSNAARGMMWDEITGDTWTIPASRMKGREGRTAAFRVPLSAPLLTMLHTRRRTATTAYVFTGTTDRPIVDQTLHKALDALSEPGQVHGFRTSFRTWAQDTQACNAEVAESYLAHITGSKVARAYARSDMLDQRRAVMDAWVEHVTTAPSHQQVYPDIALA